MRLAADACPRHLPDADQQLPEAHDGCGPTTAGLCRAQIFADKLRATQLTMEMASTMVVSSAAVSVA